MKKQFMKSLRDTIPESLIYMASPLFRNMLIQNEEFCKYYKMLEDRKALTEETIREYQFNKLKEILIYSYTYIPYYNELFKKISFDPNKFYDFRQIEQIPLLTRELVIQNFDKLISSKKVKNGYYVGKTGGSTGTPLTFYLDYDSIYKENAFIYFYRKKLGYCFNDKLATFRVLGYGEKLWRYNAMYNEILFSTTRLSKTTILEYARKINEFKPQYLNGYLSAIWFLAKLLQEYKINLEFRLKGIFLISETIDNSQREFIEHFFSTRSSTFYGHSERAVIAEEVEPNRYYFDPYYGYTEQIYCKDDEYSIVSTGFLNKTTPFIRYQTDDICSPENQYYRIEGKRCSIIGLRGKNNEFLTSTGFNLGMEIFSKFINYQFVQREIGKADLFIIVNNDFQPQELSAIQKVLDEQTKGVIDIKIKIVDKLVFTERGKFQKYICNITN
jgi:phenylacetate-CoA ligase